MVALMENSKIAGMTDKWLTYSLQLDTKSNIPDSFSYKRDTNSYKLHTTSYKRMTVTEKN